MTTRLELRWEYVPESIFEDRLTLSFEECPIDIHDGVVVATLPLAGREICSPLRTRVESRVEAMFLGVQLTTHTKLELSEVDISTLSDDGTRGRIIECKSGSLRVHGGQPDLIYCRMDGTVADTRRERIRRKHWFSTAAAKFGIDDIVLGRMLRSYRSAVFDPEDELIHLYEVRDSLKSAFGSRSEAQKKLGILSRDWSRLGQLCNDLPLRQGRHRGCVTESIRDATEGELKEARGLAAGFIELYVRYIEAGLE